jgi:hypothetical protein
MTGEDVELTKSQKAADLKLTELFPEWEVDQRQYIAALVADAVMVAARKFEGGLFHKNSFPTFHRVMGTASAPTDLPGLIALACELESLVIGAMNSADQWRFIANEMGYEPNAHAHPPFPKWLADRVSKFRAAVVASADGRLS